MTDPLDSLVQDASQPSATGAPTVAPPPPSVDPLDELVRGAVPVAASLGPPPPPHKASEKAKSPTDDRLLRRLGAAATTAAPFLLTGDVPAAAVAGGASLLTGNENLPASAGAALGTGLAGLVPGGNLVRSAAQGTLPALGAYAAEKASGGSPSPVWAALSALLGTGASAIPGAIASTYTAGPEATRSKFLEMVQRLFGASPEDLARRAHALPQEEASSLAAQAANESRLKDLTSLSKQQQAQQVLAHDNQLVDLGAVNKSLRQELQQLKPPVRQTSPQLKALGDELKAARVAPESGAIGYVQQQRIAALEQQYQAASQAEEAAYQQSLRDYQARKALATQRLEQNEQNIAAVRKSRNAVRSATSESPEAQRLRDTLENQRQLAAGARQEPLPRAGVTAIAKNLDAQGWVNPKVTADLAPVLSRLPYPQAKAAADITSDFLKAQESLRSRLARSGSDLGGARGILGDVMAATFGEVAHHPFMTAAAAGKAALYDIPNLLRNAIQNPTGPKANAIRWLANNPTAPQPYVKAALEILNAQ